MAHVAVCVMANPLDGLLEARLAAEIGQQLAIAEAAHGGSALRHPAIEQGPHFGDESAPDLTAHPVVYGAIESVPRHRHAELEGLEWGRTLALLGRHGDSGFLVDLQGANDATEVVAASLSRHGINLTEPLGEGLNTSRACLGLERRTKRGIGRNARYVPAFDDRVDVERRAANQERELAPVQ